MSALIHWMLDRTARWMIAHPKWAVAIVLLYFLSPVDVLPEALVGPLGYMDDFFVMLVPFVARAYVKRHPDPSKRPSNSIDTTAE